MNEFTKKIKIKFEADMSEVKKAGQDFKKAFEEDMKFKLDGKEIYNSITRAGSNFADKIKEVFSNAWEELSDILEYSQLSSRRTREYAFTYGFSPAQSFGYDKALSMVFGEGSTMEELMYANAQEREQFNQLFSKYSDKYNKLYDSGFFSELQSYQVEMASFQEDLNLEVTQFLVDNKDIIKEGMQAIVNVAKFLTTVLSNTGKAFGLSSSIANASDVANNYNTTNKNVNVKVDNTYNNVSSNDRAWLANAGQMTYAQIMKVLKEGY